jgi:hypothetical protein
MVCRHRADKVVFPDGTTMLASGWFERSSDEPVPDFGVYCDPLWEPTWPAARLEWPDFGVPRNLEATDAVIRDAFARARRGEQVEVACVGGHGRSGTILACMAILAGVPPSEAVAWLRQSYCERAVQEPSQQYWVERFAERECSSA